MVAYRPCTSREQRCLAWSHGSGCRIVTYINFIESCCASQLPYKNLATDGKVRLPLCLSCYPLSLRHLLRASSPIPRSSAQQSFVKNPSHESSNSALHIVTTLLAITSLPTAVEMADLTVPGKSPEVTATATELPRSPTTLPKAPNLLKSSTFMPPGQLRRPSTQFRIASSFNVRDEPKFDPVALSEPIKEDHELEEYESGSETASGSVTTTGRKISFSPVLGGQRRQSISAEEAARKKSAVGLPTQRRRSTVVAEKPSNIITWKGVDDPENPRNVSRAPPTKQTVKR